MQERLFPFIERLRYITYGLAAGLLLGMVLGWIFHGFVGTLFRIIIVALILTPFVLAVIFWQRVSNRNRDDRNRDDDRLVVRSNDPDRIVVTHEEPAGGAIRDAEWRDSR